MMKYQNGNNLPQQEEEDQNLVRFRGTYVNTIYPRNSKSNIGEEDNTYGITQWNVTEVIEGANKLAPSLIPITVVGNFKTPIELHHEYVVIAKSKEHPKYGLQYTVLYTYQEVDYTQKRNQKAFLRELLSEAKIEAFYQVYENPIAIIESKDIEAITKVKGFGEATALKLIERFESKKGLADLYVGLADYNLTDTMITKLYNHYGDTQQVINKVTRAPYDLIWEVDGIGFKTADALAIKGNLSPKSPERIKGFVYYYLRTMAEQGNSYVRAADLMEQIYAEFEGKNNILELYYDESGNKVIGNNIGQAIEELQQKNVLVCENEGQKTERRVYLTYYYNLEKQVARNLKRLISADNTFEFGNWEAQIAQLEEEQGWSFTEEQRQGIQLGLKEQVCFITGGAGTGKTSLVSGILAVLGDYSYAQTSLSGKAAARLKEVTGKDGYTIHKLLGYKPDTGGFTYNSRNKLPYQIIIIDELSLIGGEIFLRLIEAIPDGAKVLMLGDMGQLESIGCMNLASDMYYSPIVPTVELTKIHRQAQKSGIITTATTIREGQEFFDGREEVAEMCLGELQDMHVRLVPKEHVLLTVLDSFKQWYENVERDIMRIQLISPVKERGASCVLSINKTIQSRINPVKQDVMGNNIEIVLGDINGNGYAIRPNDKVLCVTNQYDMVSYAIETDEDNQPQTIAQSVDIFNGWTGLVTSVDNVENCATVYFPIVDKEVNFDYGKLLESIQLGYAITCHKMQGASAEVVIGVIDYSTPPRMLTKELLYTMLTRAEKECILIGQGAAINRAIQQSGVSDKQTFLQELLKKEIIEYI